MTKDVIELAREAGMNPNADKGAVNALGSSVPQHWIEHFAALVAARERERLTSAAMESASKAIDAAVSMTIERCANLILATDAWRNAGWVSTICPTTKQAIDAAIRALNTEGEGNV